MTPRTQGWTDAELLEEAREIESGLSEWEAEFVDSLCKQAKGGKAMSDRQRSKLRQVLDDREDS